MDKYVVTSNKVGAEGGEKKNALLFLMMSNKLHDCLLGGSVY